MADKLPAPAYVRHMDADPAHRAAELILDDMMTRKGFPALWDQVEFATKEYCVEAWAAIIRTNIKADPLHAPRPGDPAGDPRKILP